MHYKLGCKKNLLKKYLKNWSPSTDWPEVRQWPRANPPFCIFYPLRPTGASKLEKKNGEKEKEKTRKKQKNSEKNGNKIKQD